MDSAVDPDLRLDRNDREENRMKLDTLNTEDVLISLFNSQYSGISSIKNILPELEKSVAYALIKLQKGGRLIFVGAGTSGRLAAQEASELYPTFSWPKEKALFLIAGGKEALYEAREGAEDNTQQAIEDVHKIHLTEQDIVICISASGNTPYTFTILKEANRIGAYTIGIACEKQSPILEESKAQLYLGVGEEVINGSTRMASGTAQKVLLNMLTTTLMIKLNRVYDSLMVDLAITNKKLENRGIQIISKICLVDQQTATQALFQCNKEVKLACVYLKYGNIELAKKKLEEHNFNLRTCLEQV